MRKAEQIIEATPFEPGPYVQTVTYNDGEVNSIIDGVAGYSSPPATAVAVRAEELRFETSTELRLSRA